VGVAAFTIIKNGSSRIRFDVVNTGFTYKEMLIGAHEVHLARRTSPRATNLYIPTGDVSQGGNG